MRGRDEILEVLARYARALEERDGKAVAPLFAPDGEFSLFGSSPWSPTPTSAPKAAGARQQALCKERWHSPWLAATTPACAGSMGAGYSPPIG
jgi:hypothetical protein